MKQILITVFFVGIFGGAFAGANLILTKLSKPHQVKASTVPTITETGAEVLAVETTTNPQIESLETAVETPTETVIETVTSIPTATPTATPRPTSNPSPTPVPQPIYTEQEVYGFIETYSVQYGLDPNVVRHIAQCESGFNQTAVNGAYVGLFQFGTSAWVTGRASMGEDSDLNLRLNAEKSVQTATYLLAEGKSDLWPHCMP